MQQIIISKVFGTGKYIVVMFNACTMTFKRFISMPSVSTSSLEHETMVYFVIRTVELMPVSSDNSHRTAFRLFPIFCGKKFWFLMK
jgi:hypothetical protein